MLTLALALAIARTPNPNRNPNQARDGAVLFDSTVNDVRNPTIFVTYRDSQAYPDYLVQFRQ